MSSTLPKAGRFFKASQPASDESASVLAVALAAST